jgi:hypothetical protein
MALDKGGWDVRILGIRSVFGVVPLLIFECATTVV